jgi:LysM repeat protein
MDQRTRKSPARFLAPLGLIVVIVAFMAIVTSSGGDGSPASTDKSSSTTTAGKTTSSTTAAAKAKGVAKKKAATAKRFYTIQAGDTLGAIASKTGISLETIQSLNPDVDPHAMTTGQKIRLR